MTRIAEIASPEAQFRAGLAAGIQRNVDDGAPKLDVEKMVRPVNQGDGWSEVVIDLATDRTKLLTGLPIENKGYALIFSRDASTPGAMLKLDFGGGGQVRAARPGERFIGRFDRCTVSIDAAWTTQVGTCRLIITKRPDVDYEEAPPAAVGSGAIALKSTTQIVNEPVGNVPTLATDGVSLDGAVGGRVHIEADAANTITGGSVRYWVYNVEQGLWSCSSFQMDVPTGFRSVVLPDAVFSVPRGRWYAECVSVTTSAGSIRTRQEVWGA